MAAGLVEILLIEARNLVPHNKSGLCDTYVRLKVGDGFFQWLKSNTVSKSLNPKWNFFCSMKVKKTKNKLLHLKVMDSNFFALDESIGDCVVNLEQLAWSEPQDLWLSLKNTPGGEIHVCITYYPFGKDGNAPHHEPLSPDLHNLGSVVATAPLSAEQAQAEQLYAKAMDLMAKYSRSNSGEFLRMASQLLLESLKVYRLGKSFAVLAFIFYQFDNVELTSKYLGYAEQLDPSFPVIHRLRRLLVEDSCSREPLDTPYDRLSIAVVEGKDLLCGNRPLYQTPSFYCKLVVGYSEVEKETRPQPSSNPLWREFFEIALTKASERYHYGHQNLKIQIYDNLENVVMVAECREIDLFSLERDTVVDFWFPLKEGDGKIHCVINYQMGKLTDEEAAELFYNAVYCRDQPMITSLLKRGININSNFKEFAYSSAKDLEPKYSTPLTKAARFGNTRMIRDLIHLNASINAPDQDGFTPIMRAVQFDGLYNNTRAVKLLLDLGADLETENSRGYDTFGYCQSTEMRYFLKSRTPCPLYQLAVVICPNCRFIQFPACTERGENCLQSADCTCPNVSHCPLCSSHLDVSHKKMWVASKTEIEYLNKAYTSQLPDVIPHYIIQCPKCLSFGFPGTLSKSGSILTRAEGDMLIGTKHQSDEPAEFTISTASTLWMISYHGTGCPLPQAGTLVRVQLSRAQASGLVAMCSSPLTREWAQPHPGGPAVVPLESLPCEVLHLVLSTLGLEDLVAVDSTSKTLHRACRDEIFWKNRVFNDFFGNSFSPVLNSVISPYITSFRQMYIYYHLLFDWIRELLLEETFRPRYSIKILRESGHALVELRLTGRKYLFNLDGNAFTFDDEFTLALEFAKRGKLAKASISAMGQSIEKAVELCTLLPVPKDSNVNPDVIREHKGKVDFLLSLQEPPLQRWINPYLATMIPGFHSFLMLKDNVGGSIVMDFFFYSLESIRLV